MSTTMYDKSKKSLETVGNHKTTVNLDRTNWLTARYEPVNLMGQIINNKID